MGKPMFTPEELEELKRFDAEIDETYVMTEEEFRASAALDREARRRRRGRPQTRSDDTWYARNREKHKAASRAYYQSHKEKCLAYQKAYRERNRESLRAAGRFYSKAHREQQNKKSKIYYQEHREEILVKARERRARKKMNGGTENGTRAE